MNALKYTAENYDPTSFFHSRVLFFPLGGTIRGTARHLQLLKDEGGLYIRTGKGRTLKIYLKDMTRSRLIDGNLPVFYE